MQSPIISYGLNTARYSNCQKPQQTQSMPASNNMNYSAVPAQYYSNLNFTRSVKPKLSGKELLDKALEKMTPEQQQQFKEVFNLSDKSLLNNLIFNLRLQEWIDAKHPDKHFDILMRHYSQ